MMCLTLRSNIIHVFILISISFLRILNLMEIRGKLKQYKDNPKIAQHKPYMEKRTKYVMEHKIDGQTTLIIEQLRCLKETKIENSIDSSEVSDIVRITKKLTKKFYTYPKVLPELLSNKTCLCLLDCIVLRFKSWDGFRLYLYTLSLSFSPGCQGRKHQCSKKLQDHFCRSK